MPNPTEWVAARCPYCGEPIELVVDTSAGSACYIEDCPVCCQPMQVSVEVEDAGAAVRLTSCDE